jgi:hypothetical protein
VDEVKVMVEVKDEEEPDADEEDNNAHIYTRVHAYRTLL